MSLQTVIVCLSQHHELEDIRALLIIITIVIKKLWKTLIHQSSKRNINHFVFIFFFKQKIAKKLKMHTFSVS